MWEWGPARVANSRQTQIHVCIFVFWRYRKNLSGPKARMLVLVGKSFFKGTLLIRVFLELCDYVSSSTCSLCLFSFFFSFCFLGARSGMSAENRLFKVGLPRTQSGENEGPCKMFTAKILKVTLYHILFIRWPVCVPVSLCSTPFSPSDRGSISEQQGLEKVPCHWRHHSTEAIWQKHIKISCLLWLAGKLADRKIRNIFGFSEKIFFWNPSWFVKVTNCHNSFACKNKCG